MPRKRQIDPDIWTSEQVLTLPIEARLLFIGMISHADDEGRLRGSPLSLKAAIFPGDTCSLENIKAWRNAIVANKLAVCYANEGSEYLWLPSFKKFQYMTKRFPSKLPEPPEGKDLTPAKGKPVNDKLITKEQHLYGVGGGVGNGIEVGNGKDIYTALFNLWNELKIISHKKLTGDMKRAIDGAKKDYSQEEIGLAMQNYAVIVKGNEYYFSHKWTLAEFLSRRHSNNIERFLDLEIAKSNFKAEEGKSGADRQSSRQLTPRQSYTRPEDA